MDGIYGVEKRRALRIRAGLPIHYECIGDATQGSGLTQDISESGVRMTVENFVPRFSRMSLRINLDPDKPIEINGKVCWTQRVAYSPRYQIALEFQDVSPDMRRNIAEYVYSHRIGAAAHRAP